MRPANLNTKIFLDSGDPNETKKVLDMLGFLDGQTTNPSLVVQKLKQINENIKLTQEDLLFEYKKIVSEISNLITQGSVSIEVYADSSSTAEDMFLQGKEMFSWIPNAHIKYPTTKNGLEAAQRSTKEGMRVNMTLVFTQEQCAAIYSATNGAKKGDVFASPFEGRLHDRNVDGMDLITNASKMFKESGDGHVEVLAASIRDLKHFLYTLYAGINIITAPFVVLEEWAQQQMPIPGVDLPAELFANENLYLHNNEVLDIEYKDINLELNWQQYNIAHELTNIGLEKFAKDWNSLVEL